MDGVVGLTDALNSDKVTNMEAMFNAENWGSPVGLGLFFLMGGIGAAAFFWGIARLSESKKDD